MINLKIYPITLKKIFAGLVAGCLIGSGSLMSQVTLLEEDFSSFSPGYIIGSEVPTSSGVGTIDGNNNPTVRNNTGSGRPSILFDGNYAALDLTNDRINYHPSTLDSLLFDATFSFAAYIRDDAQPNWPDESDSLRINIVARPEASSGDVSIIAGLLLGVDGGVYRFGDEDTNLDTDGVFGLDKWIQFEITFDADGFNVFLDDGSSTSTISSIAFADTVTADSVLHRTETRTFGGTSNQNNDVFFVDDVSITSIPEPGAVALAFGILVGVACFIRRRRLN